MDLHDCTFGHGRSSRSNTPGSPGMNRSVVGKPMIRATRSNRSMISGVPLKSLCNIGEKSAGWVKPAVAASLYIVCPLALMAWKKGGVILRRGAGFAPVGLGSVEPGMLTFQPGTNKKRPTNER